MSTKTSIRGIFRSLGYDICGFVPISHPVARKKWILESKSIDTVLDVGANIGQYAKYLRSDVGYKGKIISFEPMSLAFSQLKLTSAGDPRWKLENYALGDSSSQQQINISENSHSSSILEMLPSLEKAAPDAKYLSKEPIQIRTLDSVFSDLCDPADKIFMKIDTQGFEEKVLKGAEASLPRIDAIQLELSLVPLYEGEMPFDHMCRLMSDSGFHLVAIEPAFYDPTSGQLMQVDGVFNRSRPASM